MPILPRKMLIARTKAAVLASPDPKIRVAKMTFWRAYGLVFICAALFKTSVTMK